MDKSFDKLSRRERQILDIIYQKNRAAVADVLSEIPDNLTYSSVRALMNILKDKGYLKISKKGRAYIYEPVIAHQKASSIALNQVINTFFDGSVESVVVSLLDSESSQLTDEEFDRLSELIESKRNKEKNDV